MSKEIPLTQGKFAIVDDDDYTWLNQWRWNLARQRSGNLYARRNGYKNGKRVSIRIHCEIIGTPEGMEIDHIDGNGLNNQKSNLRLCTRQQNLFNRQPNKRGSSKYKGVSWRKNEQKWYAQMRINGQKKSLGYFDKEESAARAYIEAAKQYHGEFLIQSLKKGELPE